MKKAISTLACNGWSLDESLDVCVKNNIEAIEIRMDLHDWSKSTLSDNDFKEINHTIKEQGILVSNLGTSIVISDYNTEALQELERCSQIATIFKCKGLRIMLGNFYVLRSEPRKHLNRSGIVNWLKEASKIAQQYDTEIWIETHNEFATGKELNKLLKEVDCENIKIVWDIMHPLEADEALSDSFNFIKPYLAHVHIKDGKPWPNPDMENYQYTRIGEGIVDIKKAISMLRQIGYSGYYSLEWEGVWRKELQGENYSPKDAVATFSKLLDAIERND